ncbi:hypothetical protein [Vibrio sp. D431a]|uniref:hypothetical protein n=1 Tax=Vibrio sp. D431a TaxID=2837388 RepID=UPI0025572BF6|nr:hypothetical protein [Vibrio sp. D431a]MDK9789844.1 hypothetical protein [Vibrio sp. D431a]
MQSYKMQVACGRELDCLGKQMIKVSDDILRVCLLTPTVFGISIKEVYMSDDLKSGSVEYVHFFSTDGTVTTRAPLNKEILDF